PTRDSAENEAYHRGDHDREHDADPGVVAEVQSLHLAGGDGIAEHERGDAVEGHLGEGYHAAVGEEEDQARGGDPVPEDLGQQLVCEVAAEDEGAERGQCEAEAAEDPVDARRGAGARRRRHPGFPNRPSGRTASTTTRSANVKTTEYSVQQLLLVVGRYEAAKLKTNA